MKIVTSTFLVTAPLIEGEPAEITTSTFKKTLTNLHLYTGAMMRDLAVEQYCMV